MRRERREEREEEEQGRERPGSRREEVEGRREAREGEERASSLWLVYILRKRRYRGENEEEVLPVPLTRD